MVSLFLSRSRYAFSASILISGGAFKLCSLTNHRTCNVILLCLYFSTLAANLLSLPLLLCLSLIFSPFEYACLEMLR